jgi:hypothetical protein
MPLGVPDRLVGEVGDAALEGLGVEEAHGFLVAGLGEQALAATGPVFSDLERLALAGFLAGYTGLTELGNCGGVDFDQEAVLTGDPVGTR